jgi:hypothetical protein
MSISEISANFYKTTRRNIPEGCHLHTRRHENLNTHSVLVFLCSQRGISKKLLRKWLSSWEKEKIYADVMITVKQF